MTARRAAPVVAGAVLVAILALGVTERAHQRHDAATAPLRALTKAQAEADLRGSPQPLAALHAQGGVLLGGGAPALEERLRALRGWPVVVNKWASWCVPCRAERTIFQRAAAAMGRGVAFIGLDSGDTSRSDAVAFLGATPMSYPSYYDRGGELGRTITDSSFTPVTVFYPTHGKPYIHQGPYESVAGLERDVERYAGHV